MIYLILAIGSSAMISICMKLGVLVPTIVVIQFQPKENRYGVNSCCFGIIKSLE